ncbi:MAG: hypothetical protein QM576_16250, partial [Rhodopseudomonas sp.]
MSTESAGTTSVLESKIYQSADIFDPSQVASGAVPANDAMGAPVAGTSAATAPAGPALTTQVPGLVVSQGYAPSASTAIDVNTPDLGVPLATAPAASGGSVNGPGAPIAEPSSPLMQQAAIAPVTAPPGATPIAATPLGGGGGGGAGSGGTGADVATDNAGAPTTIAARGAPDSSGSSATQAPGVTDGIGTTVGNPGTGGTTGGGITITTPPGGTPTGSDGGGTQTTNPPDGTPPGGGGGLIDTIGDIITTIGGGGTQTTNPPDGTPPGGGGSTGTPGSGDTDLTLDLDAALPGGLPIDTITADLDVNLDPIEAIVGDIDLPIDADLDLSGVDLGGVTGTIGDTIGGIVDTIGGITDGLGTAPSGGSDTDLTLDLDAALPGGLPIDTVTADLGVNLDPVEAVVGDIDLPIDANLDLSGVDLGDVTGTIGDTLGGLTDTLGGITDGLGTAPSDGTDTDLTLDLDAALPGGLPIDTITADLDVNLDPIEAVVGDIDLPIDANLDLSGVDLGDVTGT